MKLGTDELRKLTSIIARMEDEYQPWGAFHRELAEYILPMHYSWLADNKTGAGGNTVIRARITSKRNARILDATGTKAARDLAAGMLNGVVSPARPWFNLRLAGFSAEATPIQLQRWLEEIRRRMFLVLAESNFYNSVAQLLLDLCIFGTSGMLIYEDFDDVIRCYNLPVGEFRLAQDHRREVSTMGRFDFLRVEQIVQEFGEENITANTKQKWKKGAADLFHAVRIAHLIEPNREDSRHIPGGYAYREFYWETDQNPTGLVLRRAVYNEKPGCFPRWETVGNDTYGLSPGMDALPDIIQLQQETLRKGEGLDMMTRPPLVIDMALRGKNGALAPGSHTYVPSFSTVGAKPVFQTNLQLDHLSADIVAVQTRVRDAFFNDLFRMISQLQTVRSATEIDARREEKLVLMGAVLERLENEALDPAMKRIFSIMTRKGLIPDLPQGFQNVEVEVQYVSILSDAQRAVGTGAMERFMQVIGAGVAVAPQISKIPDWMELYREYAQRLGVPPSVIRPQEEVDAELQQDAQLQEAQQAALIGSELTGAARNLSQTDVGGGQNAFQQLLAGL